MPKLVSGDVSNSRVRRLLTEDLGNAMSGDRTVPFDEQTVGADVGGSVVCNPIVEQFFELRMQGDIAVVVQLAERDPQPVRRANLYDRIDGRSSTIPCY